MNWIPIETELQLDEIITLSHKSPQVIYKHSTRCSVSSLIKRRLENEQAPDNINFYYLDLIRYRNLSNKIAEVFEVRHQSPQVLVIHGGKSIYNESHNGILMEDIESATMPARP